MGSYAQALQHKQQLSDEERETALSDHNNTIQTLQKNMTAAQAAGDNDALTKYQTQLNQVVKDRTALFHPDQGPNAMAHLGRMVWEHVHGKKPEPSTQATTPEFQLPGNASTMGQPGPTIPASTGPVVTQRPTTPADLKERAATDLGFGVPAQPASKFAVQRQQLKEGGFTDDQIEHAMNIFAGIEAKPVDRPDVKVPYGKPIQEDGKWVQPMRNHAGEVTNEPLPEGYAPPVVAPKDSQSALSVQRREYAKAKYGDEHHALTFADEQNMIKLTKQAGAGTNVSNQTRFVRQENGDIVAQRVQQSSGKSFGGTQPTPEAPPGSTQPSAAAPKESGTTPTPAALKKNAAAVVTSSPKKSAGGVVKSGDVVGHVATPPETAAKKNVDIAESSYLDVQKASSDPTPVGDQGVVLAWLRGRVNRVTATEIAAVNNLGGMKMRLEGNAARIISGTMAPQQRAWFLQSAKNNYDNAQQVASKYKSGGADSGPSVDDLVNALNKGK